MNTETRTAADIALDAAVAAFTKHIADVKIQRVATETGMDRRTVRRMAKAMGYVS